MNRYAYTIDVSNLNQSWARLIQWTGHNRRVLDVGCGRGQIGRILNEQAGCRVTGLEINPDFARECVGYEKVVIGSAENEATWTQLAGPFDVVICGDVLEHLREPEIPLRAFHALLAPQGRLLVSVPNVAQVRIRWMHLRGRWDYTPEGIMDRTHLRWFTQASLRELVQSCGWREEEFDFTVGPNFARLLQRTRWPKRWLPATLLASQFLLRLAAHA
jgi:2-polyprenyl-3-methyl-5-hydroxy-6-metoxy-1,4-benzoquinol methylase